MKNITAIFLTFSFLVPSLLQCSRSDSAVASPAEEQAAILAVIERESRDFYKKDHAAWSRHYVHSPKVHWVCVEKDVTLRADGWNDLSQFVAEWMRANPEPMDYDKANFTLTDVQITLAGDMAFVSMKNSNIQPDGSLRRLIGSRTMLRESGNWKILSMTSYPSDSPQGSSANVYVHSAAE